MKQPSLRFLPALIAVAIAGAGSMAVATVVEAQTPPAMGPGDHGPEDGHRMHGGPGMRMMKEIERLKASLQLNANQSSLWDKAVAQMKPPTDLREHMKADHDRMTAALADPNFNPRTLAAESDRKATERHARMTSMRDAWFSVYDSLNPVQRGQVREFLRERMSHRPGMHHGGGMDDGPMRGGPMHEPENARGGQYRVQPRPDGAQPRPDSAPMTR